VTLTPADDHFAIELEGALAGMLALAQSGNAGPGSAAVSDVFRSWGNAWHVATPEASFG
jgi:hypothetical protein